MKFGNNFTRALSIFNNFSSLILTTNITGKKLSWRSCLFCFLFCFFFVCLFVFCFVTWSSTEHSSHWKVYSVNFGLSSLSPQVYVFFEKKKRKKEKFLSIISLVCLGFLQRRLLPWVNFIHSILKILMRRMEHCQNGNNFTCEIINLRWNFVLKLRSNLSPMILSLE